MEIAAKHGAIRTYVGKRVEDDAYVSVITEQQGFVEAVELKPGYSLNIANHSPTGFEWGYAGSGPAQLALALLLDALAFADPEGDKRTREHIAKRNYQAFKAVHVQNWPKQGWTMSVDEILTWLNER